MHKSKAADLQGVPKNRPTFGHSVSKRLRVYTIVAFSFIRTFAP